MSSFNDEKLKAFFFLSLGIRGGCPHSMLLFSIVLEVITIAMGIERNKSHPNWNGK